MRIHKTQGQAIKPPTFNGIRNFHIQLQKMAKTPDFAFIYNPRKKIEQDTAWLEKKTVLGHTAWNISSGYICLHFYVALSRHFEKQRFRHSEDNKRRFEELLKYSKNIESAFGHELIWHDEITSVGMYQASIFVDPHSLEFAEEDNEPRWSIIQKKLLVTAKRLNNVISPYLDRIKQAEKLQGKSASSPASKVTPAPALPAVKTAKAPSKPAKIQTAETADTLSGDKLYQQRARVALPLLVRQAKAQQTVYYSDLAEELKMPYPLNLNFVLGSIGQTLLQLSKELKEEIPPIQCLVINRATGLPGEGIGWIVDKVKFSEMPRKQQKALVDSQLDNIYSYKGWDSVLSKLGLKPVSEDLKVIVERAVNQTNFSGGESDAHRNLKNFIAANPEFLGLPAATPKGQTEYDLPSGDTVDVLFQSGKDWIAVEIKSHKSPDCDITRGLFQCVKYQAVIEAYRASLSQPINVRTVLIVGKPFPVPLIPLRNLLGIEVLIHPSS